VSGDAPKQGIRFEVLVAAALKTERQEAKGASIDLTRFAFNVNPRPFPSSLTGIGFDVSIDLTAINNSQTYLVECKSSNVPGEVLRLQSQDFLKALLKFAALEVFSDVSKWELRYLLVTNRDVGKDIIDLFELKSEQQLNSLSRRLQDYGAKEYGLKFSRDVVSAELLRRALNVTNIIHLSDQYLREKSRSDDQFRQWCESFSAGLRTPKATLLPDRGVIITRDNPRITFLCNSETHENCTEKIVDGFICHIQNASGFLDKVQSAYSKIGSPICCLIRGNELGYSPSDIKFDERASSKDVANAVSHALNSLMESRRDGVSILLVPGTFDVAVADKTKLAELVRSSFNPSIGKYEIYRVSELKILGTLVMVMLSRQVLSQEYKLATSLDDYLADDDL
jgi:hypothetical protein